MTVEDQFPGVEIADDEVDRIQVVGDLIRFIETVDNERQRRGAAPVVRNLFGSRLARAVKSTKQQKGFEEVALFFLRVAGDAMRNLIGWCPESRQPIDLQLYVDDATLSRIWSNLVRFRCPHCGGLPRGHSRLILKRNARGMGTTHAALKGSNCNEMLNVRGRNVCDAGGARRHHASPGLRAPHRVRLSARSVGRRPYGSRAFISWDTAIKL